MIERQNPSLPEGLNVTSGWNRKPNVAQALLKINVENVVEALTTVSLIIIGCLVVASLFTVMGVIP